MPIHKGNEYQTSNVEIAALFAPRPLLLISNGKDWTKNTPEVEFPYIKNIFRLYGKESNLENVHLPNEGHDYGINKRKAAYTFLARHLRLSLDEIKNSAGVITEDFVAVETEATLRVFNDKYPRPDYAIKGEAEITALMAANEDTTK
jgi:hypothetical protein